MEITDDSSRFLIFRHEITEKLLTGIRSRHSTLFCKEVREVIDGSRDEMAAGDAEILHIVFDSF